MLTVAHLSPQWLDGAGAEGEDVAEEEDEGEVDQGDDHKAIQLLLIIPLFVQDIFFFFNLSSQETICEFQCAFSCFFLYFVH